MNSELVVAWLKRRLRTARAGKLVAMVFSLVFGLLILFVSFWVTYGVIWFISHSFFPLKHYVILLIAGIFMTLVVIIGAKQSLDNLDPLQRQTHLAREMDVTLTPWTRYGISYNTDVLKAGMFEVRSMANVVNYILCGGAILLVGALTRLREFRRLQGIDVAGCARVIALLHGAGRSQSFTDIVEKLPGLNPVKVFEDLRSIEGVLFLSSDPGLTLHPDLKSDLDHLVRSV